MTPWGTVLSGEENFQEYFGAAEGAPAPNPVDADRFDRYGIALEPGELKWEAFDPRFDVAKTPNEVNRFGYVIEFDPWDPNSTPVKHSALGRLKHEGANVYVTDDGTVVVYTGDDERFDYMYKFVSSKKMQPGMDPAAMANNMTLLDEGTLFVAKLSSDIAANEIDGSGKLPSTGSFSGSGTWIPLLRSGPNGQAESQVDGITPQEAAVFTRFAADKAGATKMDRPEDFEANPKTGKVYVALTNNDERGAPGEPGPDAANPRNDNKSGQILEITDDHAGTGFTWDLLMVCGDPAAADTYFAGFDKTKVSPISCPDNRRSTATATCGSPPTATRSTPTTACSPSLSRAPTAARPGSSSRCHSAPRPAGRSSPTIWSPCVSSTPASMTTTASTLHCRIGPKAETAPRSRPSWRCGRPTGRLACSDAVTVNR